MPNMVSAAILPMKATPKADIGILSQLPAIPTASPAARNSAWRPPLVASLDGLRRRHPRRPGAGGGKHPGVEHPVEEIGVEQHGERGAREHGQNEVAAAEQKRDADGE